MSLKKHLAILGFYLGFSGLALNRLLLHIHEYVGTGQGGLTDYYHSHWNYWWIRKALTTPGLSAYDTDYVLFPFDNNLGYHTLAPFWFPLWALLEPLTNHLVAMNVILWLGLVFTGWATYLFLRSEGAAHGLALLGGALMSVQPALTWAAAMTLPVYIAGFWFPLALLIWGRVARTGRASWALLLGVVFWLMLMTDHSALLLLAVILAPYALWTLRESRARVRLVVLGLLPFAVLLLLGWFIAPLRPMLTFERDTVSPADLASTRLFALPLRGLLNYSGQTDNSIGAFITLMTVLSLSGFRERGRWLWGGVGVLGLLLALGPDIEIGGRLIPLPFRLVYELMGGVFRAAARFALVGVLALLVFVAQTWTPRWQRVKGVWRGLVGAMVLLLMVADLRVMQPFEAGLPVQPYAFHTMMGSEPDEYVVMDVPVSVGSGWIVHGNFTEAQYFALTHHKKTLSGLIARVPGWLYEFYLHDPTIGWLGGFHPLDEGVVGVQLAEYVALWDLRYIAVYQDQLNPTSGQAEDVLGFLNRLDYLCPLAIERDAVLYRTEAHPQFADCPPRRPAESAPNIWEVDWGTTGDEIHLGRGWHRQEIIGGPSGRWLGAYDLGYGALYIDLPPGADYTLTLEATAFDAPQRLQVVVNGQAVGEFVVSNAGYHPYSVTIPATALVDVGSSYIQLFYATTTPAADLRPLAVAVNWLRFER